MSSEEGIEGVIDEVLTALANITRRAIVRALAEGGSMSFAELMRTCNVKDSSTMKHHLAKLGRLVRRLEDGSYVLTPIGYEAFRLLEQLEDSLARLIPLSSTPKPLVVIKTSKRHLLLASVVAAIATLAVCVALSPYLAIAPAFAFSAVTLYAILSGSKSVLVGRSSVIEVRSTPLGRRERRIVGRVVGVEVEHDTFLEFLGLTKITVILSTAGGLRTYVVGYVLKHVAERRVEDVEGLARTSQQDRYLSFP